MSVVGALAMFFARYDQAGDDITEENLNLRLEWITAVHAEIAERFGATADGVVRVLAEM